MLYWQMIENVSNLISLLLLLFCGFALLHLILIKYTQPSYEGYRRSIIYGISLFACGLFSYLYTTGCSDLPSPLLRRCDHAAIFFLIAGTYTPFATQVIIGPFRIRLIYWIWGMAITGVLLRLLIANGYDKAFIALYLATGWTFVLALPELLKRIPRTSLIFLGWGAIVYSGGAIVFAIDPGAWTVSIWHSLVLIAAMLHYIAVLHLSSEKNVQLLSGKDSAITPA